MRKRWMVWMGLWAALSWACAGLGGLTGESDAAVPTPVLGGQGQPPATAPVGGGTGPTAPAAAPVATPTTAPTAPVFPGQTLQAGGVRITVPPVGLSLQAFQPTVPVLYKDSAGNEQTATLPIVRFGVDPNDEFCRQGCVDVIPLQPLGAGASIVFPPESEMGMVLFQTATRTLTFTQGQGQRALEVHGIGVEFVHNENLRYVFRGLSANGQYAVYATFPIYTAVLPPNAQAEGQTLPGVFAPVPLISDPQGIEVFNQQAAQVLAGLPPQQFQPPLDALDALVSSLQVP